MAKTWNGKKWKVWWNRRKYHCQFTLSGQSCVQDSRANRANASTSISITQWQGLCVALSVECQSYHFRSDPVEMSASIKGRKVQEPETKWNPYAASLKLPVGITDLSLMLSCLNIKPLSETILQRKLNHISAAAEEIGEAQIINNQMYVNRVLAFSGRDDQADVQTDNILSMPTPGWCRQTKLQCSHWAQHQ